MAHAKFTDNFNYKHKSRCMTAFKKGYEGTVKREILEAAIKAGKAIEVKDTVRVDIKDEK